MHELRKSARAWKLEAATHRGYLEVEPGTWALALPDGGLEVLHRTPTSSEERRALGDTSPAPVTRAEPIVSDAERRLAKLFGARK